MLKTAAFAAVALLGTAAAAQAKEPGVEIRDTAARVTVIPEARQTVSVTITPGRAPLPRVYSRVDGRRIVVEGDLDNRIDGCTEINGRVRVRIRGVGNVPLEDLPQITVRLPLDANVDAGGALWGTVGRTNSLKLGAAGCGDWSVADVAGPMSLALAGSGDVKAGSAGRTQARLSGSGDIVVRSVNGGLEANLAGSGDIRVASLNGPLNASLAGSGDIRVDGGSVADVQARVAGSGDIRVDAPVAALAGSVAGSGAIYVASANGPVSRSVIGSGDIYVGR